MAYGVTAQAEVPACRIVIALAAVGAFIKVGKDATQLCCRHWP
jgi:hypothetical protein